MILFLSSTMYQSSPPLAPGEKKKSWSRAWRRGGIFHRIQRSLRLFASIHPFSNLYHLSLLEILQIPTMQKPFGKAVQLLPGCVSCNHIKRDYFFLNFIWKYHHHNGAGKYFTLLILMYVLRGAWQYRLSQSIPYSSWVFFIIALYPRKYIYICIYQWSHPRPVDVDPTLITLVST